MHFAYQETSARIFLQLPATTADRVDDCGLRDADLRSLSTIDDIELTVQIWSFVLKFLRALQLLLEIDIITFSS